MSAGQFKITLASASIATALIMACMVVNFLSLGDFVDHEVSNKWSAGFMIASCPFIWVFLISVVCSVFKE